MGAMLHVSDLISHRFRGFGPRDAQENTLVSLRGALDWGVEIVEFDVRVARCGTPVVYHDEWALDGDKRQRSLSDVAVKDFNKTGGRFADMPTLDALLALAADHANPARLLVDIKDAVLSEAAIALVRAHGLAERVVYVSWLPEVLYAVSEREPEAALCLSHWARSPSLAARAVHDVFESVTGDVPCPEPTPTGTRSGWWLRAPLSGELAERIARTHGYVCVPAADVSAERVEAYHARGIRVSAFSYVALDPALAARAQGVDLLFSDSKTLFEAVRAREGHSSGMAGESGMGASPSRPGMA